MNVIKREEVKKNYLPSRIIQGVIGKNGFSQSEKMTMGFAHYSVEIGPMEPHHHAEEVIYVIGAENAWVSSGSEKDTLGKRTSLKKGMVLHFKELEWHVFEYNEDGYLDIIFFYGQVDNIRPENK